LKKIGLVWYEHYVGVQITHPTMIDVSQNISLISLKSYILFWCYGVSNNIIICNIFQISIIMTSLFCCKTTNNPNYSCAQDAKMLKTRQKKVKLSNETRQSALAFLTTRSQRQNRIASKNLKIIIYSFNIHLENGSNEYAGFVYVCWEECCV
jgi:hypothetical protein